MAKWSGVIDSMTKTGMICQCYIFNSLYILILNRPGQKKISLAKIAKTAKKNEFSAILEFPSVFGVLGERMFYIL